MDNTKIAKVKNWIMPHNVIEVCKFLGFIGYYQYFIQDYSRKAHPLLYLTHNTTPWHWGPDQQKAFETLHDAMCNKPVLRQPDFTKPFYILTDASAYDMGAILLQEGESAVLQIETPHKKPKLHPVAYYSATFTETERNYDIYDRELLAIIKAITHWRPYLIWTEEPFTIYTDHAAA